VELSTWAADDAPSVRLAGSSAASSWEGGLGGLCRRVFIVFALKESVSDIFFYIYTIILLLGRCKLHMREAKLELYDVMHDTFALLSAHSACKAALIAFLTVSLTRLDS
jgi:hypothetical protein